MLLAAGEGARLRPLTEKLPKPMIPIAGKPILEHNVELLAQHGIHEIAINLHHCPDVIAKHFGDGSRFGMSITYSYEPEVLGTAGAVKKLESYFQDTFLVIYADNLIKCDLKRLLSFHKKHQGVATIALHFRDDVVQSGVAVLDAEDRLTLFVEKPQPAYVSSHWVNAGVLVLEREVLGHIPPGIASDFGREILPRLLEKGERLYGYRLRQEEGPWWIDTLADLQHVQGIFKEAIAP